ncbi:MAG TPA: rRNA pseudouridine synthase [Clostridia bacterium]|nr:rRNA pseudouridine synthase [Clostridia bacterium]
MKERLHKYLARCGIASRREAEKLITEGRVEVNGKTVTTLGTTVDPGTDLVRVDGQIIKAAEKHVYIMLNKPAGFVTTARDDRGRPTVLDLVKHVPARVFPVGRLDMDTEGLLLLTNDGALAYKLTHPRFQVKKTYRALVQGQPGRQDLDKLRRGIMLDGRLTAPAQVRIIGHQKGHTLLELTIHEGRNRQIRRMLDKIGHPVVYLRRIKMAGIELGNLPLGQTRYLTPAEIKQLHKAVSPAKA